MTDHHPSADMLSAYARGILSNGVSLVVSCHLDGCGLCRNETGLWESVGGAVVLDVTPAAMSDGALALALGKLDERPQKNVQAGEARKRFVKRFALPEAVTKQKIGFRRWVTPNIWFAPIHLAMEAEQCTYLLYARKGTTFPRHTHKGKEFTTVLYGRFSDDSGLFDAGDFAETDASIVHAPAVASESECLCVISSDAPMRLLGSTARVIQTLAGRLY